MKRGYIPSTSSLDALMQQLQQAIENGDDAQTAALQTQIDALNSKVETAQSTADTAQATGANARQMVITRDPRLSTLEGVADTVQQALLASEQVHKNLESRIDNIELTPGPAGKDGADGKPGAAGTNGADGLNAYQVARAAGYGGTQAQWLATLKGDQGPKGDTGQAGKDANVQVEYRDGIAVPAILSLLGLSATTDVTITWPTPFPDTAYIVTPQVATSVAGLVGKTTATLKSKTPTGCVVTVTTTALIAAGQATLSAIAIRKS